MFNSLQDLPWAVIAAGLITGTVLGRALDLALSRYYTPRLQAALNRAARRVAGLTALELLHGGLSSGRTRITKFFESTGVGRHLPLLCGFIGGVAYLPFDAEVGGPGRQGSFAAFMILVYWVVSTVARRLAILASRLAGDSLTRLVVALAFNLACSYVLVAPFPLLITWSLLDRSQPAWLVYWPMLHHKAPAETALYYVVIAGAAAALPNILYLYAAMRDLFLRVVLRPLAWFMNQLLEALAREQRPVTWVLTTLGALPALIKAWLEVGGMD